jgi:hypothetical protein
VFKGIVLSNLFYGSDDSVLICFRKVIIKGQPEQAITYVLGNRAVAFLAAEFLAHSREVKWQVMKNGIDVAGLQVAD